MPTELLLPILQKLDADSFVAATQASQALRDAGVDAKTLVVQQRQANLPVPHPKDLGGMRAALLRQIRLQHQRGVAPCRTAELPDATGVTTTALFSPNGTYLFLTPSHGQAAVWNTQTTPMSPIALAGHTGRVNFGCFSPDGTKLATVSDDKTTKIWDLTNAAADPMTLPVSSQKLARVVYAPNGDTLLAESADGTFALWDVRQNTVKRLEVPEELDAGQSPIFLPDGRMLGRSMQSGTAIMYDMTNPSAGSTTLRHDGAIASMQASDDGRAVCIGYADATAKLWLVGTSPAAAVDLGAHTSPIVASSFSKDGRFVVTTSKDKTVMVWDTTKRPLTPLDVRAGNSTLVSATFSADSRHLLTRSSDGIARVVDMQDSRGAPMALDPQNKHGCLTATFFSDSRFVVTTSLYAGTKVWDITKRPATCIVLDGSVDTAQAAFTSPDGRFVVETSLNGPAVVSDFESQLDA